MKEVVVCKEGEVVTNGAAVLLKKLNIEPFQYGMKVLSVYEDGSILNAEVIALTPEDICANFTKYVNNISAMSLALGLPVECSVPHMIANGFKNIAAFSLESGFKIEALEKACAAGPVATGGAAKV
jgi:large subunit ribosomal protein LP0